MALDKLPLLAVLYFCYHIAVTAPNPPASRKEISKYPTNRVDTVSHGPIMDIWALVKAAIFLVIACEITVIVSAHFTTNVFAKMTSNILVRTSSTSHTPSIGPMFMTGFLLCLFGTYVRWSAYRALGRLFTFEVSIRDQHRLITTYPYSIVRHPSYIGSFAALPSINLCIFGPGSWIFECGWLELLPVQIFAVLMSGLHAYVLYILVLRLRNEDEMMKKEFGKQWDEWAKNVPYKLIPGVI
ncbi:hypothetical protein BDP27DRAFT_1434850 [Rhodocollybia butyracea]|uniref:Protein-S-isoprenylcysteine O-methyltransferase n=1 Tax=Rhodocollybia butyracea TaxID=206335 RepID=A0A9P5P7W7_9AGAR|nr:hypothetical protein BDP27DRAFT_1434850 [Rhodocollybia butyracea]